MGAKGAVEIIFRGKDVAEREKEYTELFCNPMVRDSGINKLWERVVGSKSCHPGWLLSG